MQKLLAVLSLLLLVPFANAAEKKEWTFLIFLNGNNNLDRYGAINLNQIEAVGSTDKINVVVQWASLSEGTVKRLYMTRDNDSVNVTSPVLQDMGQVDMGDYKNLVEFARWGAENFPAEHYFVDLWDHGSGWHPLPGRLPSDPTSTFRPFDISWDDLTGNHITTPQMGLALKEISEIFGKKIDILGADACLMAMAEIGSEIADSSEILLGSEEVEPAAGWPYDQLLAGWEAAGSASAETVSRILTREYVRSYQGGQNGMLDVALSSLDLRKLGAFESAMATLSAEIQSLPKEARAAVLTTMQATQNFTYSDYGDVVDFIELLRKNRVESLNETTLTAVEQSALDMVISNDVSAGYRRARGMAMWLPTYKSTYDMHAVSYDKLKFNAATQWGAALKSIHE